jgi:hypothetical protein
MAVADLVAEWFETDLLQAAVAARAIHGTAMGPWSAGTGAVLLLAAALIPAWRKQRDGGRRARRVRAPWRCRARGQAPRSARERTCSGFQ